MMTTTFEYNGETLTIKLAQYQHGYNRAIMLTDAQGTPYAHVTTNPPAYLPTEWVCIDEDYFDKVLVQAMVDEGIITPLDYTIKTESGDTLRVYVISDEVLGDE